MILKIFGLSFLLVSGERFVPQNIDGVSHHHLVDKITKSPFDVREYVGLELRTVFKCYSSRIQISRNLALP
ncbi:hypothetical protein DSO57_1004448 [Entomophthora muscae]|uniref:Uncharacterized protein n=1 Tax=Entomophthora muscae TaxID=34485 RepID=A0ACC2UIB7_9FUNG|nr:hypothetical protein DSO57_1004448 [Entomophthora muscae]